MSYHQDLLSQAFNQVKKDVKRLTSSKTYENLSQNQIIGALTVLLLVVGVVTGMYLGTTGQDIRQEASTVYPNCGPGSDPVCVGGIAGGSCVLNGTSVGKCSNSDTNPDCTCQAQDPCVTAGGTCRAPGACLSNETDTGLCTDVGANRICCKPKATSTPIANGCSSRGGVCVSGGCGEGRASSGQCTGVDAGATCCVQQCIPINSACDNNVPCCNGTQFGNGVCRNGVCIDEPVTTPGTQICSGGFCHLTGSPACEQLGSPAGQYVSKQAAPGVCSADLTMCCPVGNPTATPVPTTQVMTATPTSTPSCGLNNNLEFCSGSGSDCTNSGGTPNSHTCLSGAICCLGGGPTPTPRPACGSAAAPGGVCVGAQDCIDAHGTFDHQFKCDSVATADVCCFVPGPTTLPTTRPTATPQPTSPPGQPTYTPLPTDTPLPPTNTPVNPTNTPIVPTNTQVVATNTPVIGPVCAMVTINNPGATVANTPPKVNDIVTLTCAQVAGASRYMFRMKLPDGTFFPVLTSTTTPNISQQYKFDFGGAFVAQCRPCAGAADTTCSPWE